MGKEHCDAGPRPAKYETITLKTAMVAKTTNKKKRKKKKSVKYNIKFYQNRAVGIAVGREEESLEATGNITR